MLITVQDRVLLHNPAHLCHRNTGLRVSKMPTFFYAQQVSFLLGFFSLFFFHFCMTTLLAIKCIQQLSKLIKYPYPEPSCKRSKTQRQNHITRNALRRVLSAKTCSTLIPLKVRRISRQNDIGKRFKRSCTRQRPQFRIILWWWITTTTVFVDSVPS